MRQYIKVLFLLILILAMTACTIPPERVEPAVPDTTTVEAEPTDVPTEETEPSAEATEPPAEETVTPAEETEPPVETPSEPQLVLHSGLREDGSFDEGTWFIGDSMTCILVENYLAPNGLLGDANYTGKYGAHITAFFDDTVMSYTSYNHCAFRPEHEGMGYDDLAVELGEKATAIYMMWGTNYTWNAYADAYIEITDFLLETCPNATIHLQLIPWGYEELIRYDIVNEWVREAYEHYQEKGEERVFLIDTFTAIGKNTDEHLIHLADQGNENWYNAILDHAEANALAQ